MHNRNAVRNIVHAHVSKINRDSNYLLKVCLYSLAVVVFLTLNALDYPAVAWVALGGIFFITLITFGLPNWVFVESFEREIVPDDIYMSVKRSKEIEPELLDLIRYHRSPDLTVSRLMEVEKEYHRVKKATSAPGYRSLDIDEPEAS